MVDIQRKVVLVFRKCREIEETCMAMYQHLAELFASDAEAAALFGKTAVEENNHARQFELAEKISGEIMSDVSVTLDRVTAQLNIVRSIQSSIRKHPPSLEEALRFSIKLEQGLAGFHLDQLGLFKTPEGKRLFGAMMAADHEHVDSLTAAYKALLARKMPASPSP